MLSFDWRKRVRTLCSYLPSTGLVKRPSQIRPKGISVAMTVKNEEGTIEPSILSIKDFADEIVVVDASTDSTMRIIRRVVEENGFEEKVKLIHFDVTDANALYYQKNIALANTSYSWIVRWDGDFIARTSGEYDIRNLRRRILSLPDRYFTVSYPLVWLDGDLYHQRRTRPLHTEVYCFSYPPSLRHAPPPPGFGHLGGFLHFPFYYKRTHIPEIYVFHCNVKPLHSWSYAPKKYKKYFNTPEYEKRFSSFDDYFKYRILEDWNTDDYEEALAANFVERMKSVEPYDKERFGDYPALLRKALEKPKYRLFYEDGRVVGRSDTVRLPKEILEKIYDNRNELLMDESKRRYI